MDAQDVRDPGMKRFVNNVKVGNIGNQEHHQNALYRTARDTLHPNTADGYKCGDAEEEHKGKIWVKLEEWVSNSAKQK